jgi:calcium/calmodulin-dependent protein kinase kinase 2
MKAAKRFKDLLRRGHYSALLGKGVRVVQPPQTMSPPSQFATIAHSSRNSSGSRQPLHPAIPEESHDGADGLGVHNLPKGSPERMDSAVSGVSSDTNPSDRAETESTTVPSSQHSNVDPSQHQAHPNATATIRHMSSGSGKGHAHDPLTDEPLHLNIGVGTDSEDAGEEHSMLSDSPPATDFDVYEKAYQEELARIRTQQGHQATVYSTKRVDSSKALENDEFIIRGDPPEAQKKASKWGKILGHAKTERAASPAPAP